MRERGVRVVGAAGRARARSAEAFTVVEMVVAMTVFSIILIGIVGMQAASLRSMSLARARTLATQVANQRMEYIRATNYDNIGVQNPPPGEVAGALEPSQVVTLNAEQFTVTTHVFWVDDPADGTANNPAHIDYHPDD